MGATAEFDPEPLADLGDPEIERELVEMFLVQAADRVLRLERAIDGRDRERVRELAHELKGASATVGAVNLGTLCQRLCDLAGRGGDIRHARELLGDVSRTLASTGVTTRRHAAGPAR
jgi:HPt (histidine-containing phosphotransfer) domain-containing protein